MKKIIFLLFPFLMLAQNPTNFPYGIKNSVAPTDSTPAYFVTSQTDGLHKKTPAALVALKSDLPVSYSKIVYVNTTSPLTATIFDDENPPTTNDNAFKADVDNLYIGTDASTWVWNSSTYVTKVVPDTSNFNIDYTLVPAGNDKSSDIYRNGGVGTSGFFRSQKGLAVNRNGSNTVLNGPYIGLFNDGISAGNTLQLNASNGVDIWNYASGAYTKRFTFSSAGNFTAATYNGYTPENSANKSSSYIASSTTTYPDTKALVDGLATKQNTLTNPTTGAGSQNDPITYALQDGIILYHSTKWFVPTGTVSTSGATVTSVGTQFTNAMVGAKITINGEWRIITAYTSTTVVTVESAYSQDYSGVVAGSWGVYSKSFSNESGTQRFYSTSGSSTFNYNSVGLTNVYEMQQSFGRGLFADGYLAGHNEYAIKWSNGGNVSSPKDLGLRKNAPGVLEIYNGVTADGAIGNRRDLLARNYTGSATLTGTPTAPTATAGTNTTQIATTAFVQGEKAITVRKISTNTTLDNTDNGKVILLTASCTVTLPNGLMSGFNVSFATQAGATLTYSLGGSVVLVNNAGTTMGELSSHTIVNTGVSNEYLTVGL